MAILNFKMEPMAFAEFEQSVRTQKAPPTELPPALQALWHDAKGDWERAHECAQQDPSRDGAWVHAYVHRREGDDGNASYWYARAGRKFPGTSSKTEWSEIARELLLKTADDR
jgi:hypothetical protein